MKKYRTYLLFSLLMIILFTLAGCKPKEVNPPVSTLPEISEPVKEFPVPMPPVVEQPVEQPAQEPPAQAAPEKSLSWWFTRNNQHQIPIINKDTVQLLAQNNGLYVIPNSSKKIYLTFDNGYELGYTSKILDVLDRKQIKAAFFITGQYIKTQPELVKRMQASGHLVCNHTWNHPDLSTLSQEKFNEEVKTLEQSYSALTGQEIDRYLRPPMGKYSSATLRWANELGYSTVFWSIAFADWDPNNQPGAAYSHNHVLTNIHPGAVILLHAVSQSDTDALEQIITDLQGQGYIFSTFKG